MMIATNNKMSNQDNNMTRRFPAAFGGERRGGGGYGNNQRGGGPRRYQHEVRYPAPVKKEEPKTVDVTSEMNFPALGGGGGWRCAGAAAAGAGTGLPPAYKSFASMASDWKETEEQEAARIAYERSVAEADNRRNRGLLTGIFTKSRLNTESHGLQQYYDEEYDEEYVPSASGYPEDEGWNMIDNAKKRSSYPPQYADRGSRWEENREDEDEEEEY